MIIVPFWLKRVMDSNGLTVAVLKDNVELSKYISKQDIALLSEINSEDNLAKISNAFLTTDTSGRYDALPIQRPLEHEMKIHNRMDFLEGLIGIPVDENIYEFGFSPECVDGVLYLHVGVIDKKDPENVLHGKLQNKMLPYGKELISCVLEICYVNKLFGNHECGPVAAMARSDLMTAFTRF